MRLPQVPAFNPTLSDADKAVLLLDVLPIHKDDCIDVRIMSAPTSSWRQGVFLATEGILEVGDISAPSMVLWSDSAPPISHVCVRETDGLIRLYNVWDSGRGLAEFESQSATSGMLRTDREDGIIEYRCSDIGLPPTFDKLTIEVSPGRR